MDFAACNRYCGVTKATMQQCRRIVGVWWMDKLRSRLDAVSLPSAVDQRAKLSAMDEAWSSRATMEAMMGDDEYVAWTDRRQQRTTLLLVDITVDGWTNSSRDLLQCRRQWWMDEQDVGPWARQDLAE
ncbi:AAA domain-containing protein [Psidium guajava]|nr:AAA domain-containing protein [Psidium guajava]